MTCEKCGGTRGVTSVYFKDLGRKRYSMCIYCMRQAPLFNKDFLRRWLGEPSDYLKFRTFKGGVKHDIKFKFER